MKKLCIYVLLFSTIGIFPSYSFNPREADKSDKEIEEVQEIDKTNIEDEEPKTKKKNTVKVLTEKKSDDKKVKEKKPKEKLTALEYYNKGREAYLNFNTKGYEESISFYNKALELDKNFAKALSAKAESQALLSRTIYDSTNNIKDSTKFESIAFENAYIAISMNPEISETHRALSMVYFIQKKYQDGQEQALKAIEINSNDAEAQLLLWLNSPDKKSIKKDNTKETFYKSLNIDSEIIDRALDLNSELQLSLLELGNTFANQNEHIQAIKYYKKIIKLNPSNEDAYIALGNIYNTNSEHDKSIENFDKVLEINPDRYDAIYGLGMSFLKKRETPQAEEYLNKACEYEYDKACEVIDSKGRRNNRRGTRLRRQFNGMSLYNF